MNRAALEAIRDSNWGDTAPDSPSTPLRDPVCDRTIFDTLLDEAFSLPVYDNGTAPDNTITTKVTISGFSYKMHFKKGLGNYYFVKGWVKATSGGVDIDGVTIANISNTEFIPEILSGINQNVYAFAEDSSAPVLHLRFNNAGTIVGSHAMASLEIGVNYEFNAVIYTAP